MEGLAEIVASVVGDIGPDDLCYAASEAYFHLTGGTEGPWKPEYVSTGDSRKHWFLRHKKSGAILDLTAAQFKDKTPEYHKGKGCGFLPVDNPPSMAAKVILDHVRRIIWSPLN